jgi:AcrR family transcriptional regulator
MQPRASRRPSLVGRASRVSTMDKILDYAEKEFAARGYSGTPLHKIAAGAKVNQALINYYFGSKEKLYQAVFLRRGKELTEERLRLLDELESRSPRPSVEELIRCFIVPAIGMWYNGNANFLRLQARLSNEPKELTKKLRALVYDEATLRYIKSFQAALPQIEPKAIVWRLVMMIGAYLYVISDASRLEQLSGGASDTNTEDEVVRQLTAFFTGGFRQPSLVPVREPRSRRTAA